ncbi:MAG TPA: RagB/SusD family nutrient uptake outer membrane protein [Longimicrobiaceae bacterium]
MTRFLSALRSRTAALGVALAASGGLAGCDSLLDVENPQAINAENLSDPFYLGLLTNGVVGDFQRAYDDLIYYSAVFSDELRNHTTIVEEQLIDQRRIDPDNGTLNVFMYQQVQRARFLADSTAIRFRTLRGDTANSDLRLARVLAYAGTTYNLLGEHYCEIPVNLSAPHTPQAIFRDFSIPRFNDAIAVATAARAAASSATTAGARTIAGADSIINLSRVGIARAALNLGNLPLAAQNASQVPNDFVFRSFYSENSTEENHVLFGRMTAPIAASVTGTPFEGLRDPRVPLPTANEAVQGGGRAFVPNSPSAYSTYTGTLPGGEFTRSSSIRIASGLEAQYIRAEAEGPNATTLAFINARRALGTQAALPATVSRADFLAAVRDERRRDLYMDGHRVGDLRRYEAQYGNIEDFNEYQRGSYLGSTTIDYADVKCFPVSRAEINANPFYR